MPVEVTIYFSPVQEASFNTREAPPADEGATAMIVHQ